MSQGQINAKMVALLSDEIAMAEYEKTLTENQRELAKSHLRTVLNIQSLGLARAEILIYQDQHKEKIL